MANLSNEYIDHPDDCLLGHAARLRSEEDGGEAHAFSHLGGSKGSLFEKLGRLGSILEPHLSRRRWLCYVDLSPIHQTKLS